LVARLKGGGRKMAPCLTSRLDGFKNRATELLCGSQTADELRAFLLEVEHALHELLTLLASLPERLLNATDIVVQLSYLSFKQLSLPVHSDHFPNSRSHVHLRRSQLVLQRSLALPQLRDEPCPLMGHRFKCSVLSLE